MENADLEELRQTFIDRVEAVVQGAREFRDSMERFAYLWTEDREESLKGFLNEITRESEAPQSMPSLDRFKEKIDEYESICAEVSSVYIDLLLPKDKQHGGNYSCRTMVQN